MVVIFHIVTGLSDRLTACTSSYGGDIRDSDKVTIDDAICEFSNAIPFKSYIWKKLLLRGTENMSAI